MIGMNQTSECSSQQSIALLIGGENYKGAGGLRAGAFGKKENTANRSFREMFRAGLSFSSVRLPRLRVLFARTRHVVSHLFIAMV